MNSQSAPTILVVNDDPLQLHLTASLLEREGMRVLRCTGAEEALRLLSRESHLDVIITDLHMPGIDGWRFCRLLRSPDYAAFNHTPILVISATFSGADAERVTVDLGANAFLPLPHDAPTLRGCVRKLLEGRTPKATLRVLIVGDASDSNGALVAAFTAHGCKVLSVASAEEGLRHVCEDSPEIVVLDYDLLDLGGDRLLRAAKVPGSSTVALIVTSDSIPSKAVELMRQGADGYVRKPYDPEYLITLADKARRERALLRVEELLEQRTISLRDSEARFRSLVEGIVEIILVCDEAGVIQHINKVGAERLEWVPDQLVGKPLSTILAPEAAGALTTTASQRDTETPCHEITYHTRGGRRIEVEVSERQIVFNGQPAVMTVARDITERRHAEEEKGKLEAQLQEAQKMEAIGTLAGGVAHDFNNLLTVIMGHSALLKNRAKPGDELYQDITTIESVVQRAKALTDQLLGFARRGKHQHALVDIRESVRDVVALLSRTIDKKIQFKEELCSTPALVLGDPGQLHQVILNLSVNARDAMPEGGDITFKVDITPADKTLRLRYPGVTAEQFVRLSVCDTGCGITAAIQRRIFEPFFTTKGPGKGTGMGLAMVYGIVKNHGGVIDVESVPSRGTTFTLYLPLASQPQMEKEDKEQERPVGGSGKILLVEDEELVRNIAARLLRHLGYEVAMASDGLAAVEYYREHGREIGLVVLDMVMPKMNGRDCFRALRAMNPHVKAILSTGYDQNHATQDLLDEGVQGFVQKPYDLVEFSRTIEKALLAEPKPNVVRSS